MGNTLRNEACTQDGDVESVAHAIGPIISEVPDDRLAKHVRILTPDDLKD